MHEVIENLSDALAHRQPTRVPVVLWSLAPFVTRIAGVPEHEYYKNPAAKLRAQTWLQEQFPDTVMFPGIWADFGIVPEASAFGCEVVWFDNDAPYVRPAITSLEEIGTLRLPDPQKSGLMPQALEQYAYLQAHADVTMKREYGYLDGVAFCTGPLETAALIVGYDRFLVGLYDDAEKMHRLISLVTDALIVWIEAQQAINGKIKRLFVADHMANQVSLTHFREFCFPYMKKLFGAFPASVSLYHNEGNVYHILEEIPRMGANVFHFGVTTKENKVAPGLDDLKLAKKCIGDRICLMGNLDPVKEILPNKREDILRLAKERLHWGAPGGGYLLSGGGGMAPGTSCESIRAILQATREFSSTRETG